MGPYSLGFCKWDLPVLIVVIIAAAAIAVHNYRHGKKAEQYRRLIEKERKGVETRIKK